MEHNGNGSVPGSSTCTESTTTYSDQESALTPTEETAREDSTVESSSPSSSLSSSQSSLLDDATTSAYLETCGTRLELRGKDNLPATETIFHSIPEEMRRFEGREGDVSIKVEGAYLSAHKGLLSARVPYFNAMFGSEWAEASAGEIDLSRGISRDILENLLDWASTAKLVITEDNVVELLMGARYLNIEHVISECAQFVSKRMTIFNILMVRRCFQLIDFHGIDDILWRFLNANFVPITRTPDFLELSIDEIMQIIQSDTLNIDDEKQVFEAVDVWMMHDTERRPFGSRLLKFIRFDRLPSSFLSSSVERTQWVMDSDECIDLVNEAKGGWNSSISTSARITEDTRRLIVAICCTDPAATFVYDPPTNSWSRGSTEHQEIAAQDAAAVIGQKLYLLGQECSVIYDTSTNQFNDTPGFDKEIYNFTLGAIDESIYVCGGSFDLPLEDGDFLFLPMALVFKLDTTDPSAGWKEMAPMTRSRSDASSCVLDGKLYVIGGECDREVLSDGDVYDPSTEYWTRLPPMKWPRKRCAAVAYRGKIIVAGGSHLPEITRPRYEHLKTAEMYDPATNEWTQLADMNHRKDWPDLAVSCGRLLVFCAGTAQPVEEYLPEKDEWVERAAPPLTPHERDDQCGWVSFVLPIAATWPIPQSALE